MSKVRQYLDDLTKIIALSTAIGVVFGLSVAYVYLDFIQHKSLFVNILNQPSSFVIIIFIFSITVFSFFLAFCTPYKLALTYQEQRIDLPLRTKKDEGEKNGDKKESKKNKRIRMQFSNWIFVTFFLSSFIPIISSSVIIWIFYNEYNKLEYGNLFFLISVFVGMLLPVVIFVICWLWLRQKTNISIQEIFQKNKANEGSTQNIGIRYIKNKFNLNAGIAIAIDIFVVSFATLISVFLVFVPIIGFWIEDEDLQWWIFWISIIVMALNSLLASFLLYRDSPVKGPAVFGFPLCLAIIFFMVIFQIDTGTHQKLLYPARFVEIPEDSSWYLLHNNYQINNKFKEINGINNYDLEKIKSEFSNYYSNDKGVYSEISNQRKNALYGYMAWNLGNIKVFCPRHIKFTQDNKQNALLAKKCLSINSESIQALDSQYISLGTIQ